MHASVSNFQQTVENADAANAQAAVDKLGINLSEMGCQLAGSCDQNGIGDKRELASLSQPILDPAELLRA